MNKKASVAIMAFFMMLAIPALTSGQTLTPEQKAALEQELAKVEAEQKQAAEELANAKAKSSSLQRDIAILDAKIKSAQLEIKAKTLKIQTLGNDIVSKEKKIDDLESHIDKGKETLAQLLRKTNEYESYSLPEIILANSSISGFFEDMDTFESVQIGLKETFEKLRDDQQTTKEEKSILDERRDAEINARYEIEKQRKNVESDQKEKQKLLGLSKNSEKAYASLLAEKQSRAAQIRAQLFALRDATAIPFGQALQYATFASQKTGVRPAFILAIITQESALGKNVGSCYVTNYETGAGISSKTGNIINKVMSPTRDIPPFLEITKALGTDPAKTVVSCPQSIGWGGAMGPAQFIASTWMIIKDKLARSLDISGMPDPWNPAHAFMASAMYLADLGASAQTYTAERNAACKYYSGRSCGLVSGNTTYGNSVVTRADTIQRTMIDPLQGL